MFAFVLPVCFAQNHGACECYQCDRLRQPADLLKRISIRGCNKSPRAPRKLDSVLKLKLSRFIYPTSLIHMIVHIFFSYLFFRLSSSV